MGNVRSRIVLVAWLMAATAAPCVAQIFIPDATKDIIKVPPPNARDPVDVDKNSLRINTPLAPDERCGRLTEPLRRQTPGCR